MNYPTHKEIRKKKLGNKLDRVLEEERTKFPLPTPNGRFPITEFLRDEEALEALFSSIALGNSVRQFCTEMSFPQSAITGITRALAKLKAPDPREEQYRIAKAARANQFADRMLDMVEQVETGVMTPQQGSFCVRSLQWLAERMDPEHFSGRIQVDANVKVDTATSHLEAVRMMANMVKEGRPGTVYEGEVVEELPPSQVEDYEELLE